jgi:hypothetical protein
LLSREETNIPKDQGFKEDHSEEQTSHTEQSERKVDPMHPSQDGCKDHTATVSNVNDQPLSARLLLTETDPD